MAEVTAMRNNVLDFPIYGLPYVVIFPILDNTGELVDGAAELDSEISKNGDTFTDCTNEAVEIAASSGMYYLILTAAEMTADIVSIRVRTTTVNAKTTPITFKPQALPQIDAGTAQAGAAGSITLAAGTLAFNDQVNGAVVYIHTGTGAGQARIITSFVTSTKVASVTPDFITNPDDTSQYYLYQTDSCVASPNANIMGLRGSGQSLIDLKDLADTGYDPATHKIEVVKLVDVTTENTDMRGTDNAALDANYTAARAANLDNLSAGAVALEATLTAIKGGGWTDENLKLIKELVEAIPENYPKAKFNV